MTTVEQRELEGGLMLGNWRNAGGVGSVLLYLFDNWDDIQRGFMDGVNSFK